MKVGAHLCIDEHRRSLINDIEDFYHMLPLAVDLRRHGRGILKIELPVPHRCGTLLRLLHLGQSVGDASGLLQDAVDRPARAREALPLNLLIARQIVQQCFGPRRAPQALWWLIAHLEDAVDHHLADALRRMHARSRATGQHLLVLRLCLLQALLPFLDPAPRHAQRLGILGVRRLLGLYPQWTQISAGCIVYCFHNGTSWLTVFHSASSVPFFLLSPQATM